MSLTTRPTRPLVVLDLDGTVIQGSLGTKLAEELHRLGQFREWDKYARNQVLFKDPQVPYDDAIATQSRQYARCLRGVAQADVVRVARTLGTGLSFTTGFDEFHRYCRASGFRLHLLTSSPLVAVTPVTDRFLFDQVDALAFRYEGGHFSGEVEGEPLVTSVKAAIVDRVAPAPSVYSCGVGDTLSDMLAFRSLSMRLLIGAKPAHEPAGSDFIRVQDFTDALAVVRRSCIS